MRLHSVTLRNFRGVAELFVEFSASGITVVEGDNGTGKTSLMQAVDIIFRYPDSSKAQVIEDIRPEGRDVGAEIELVVSLAQYRLTYEKKYHRNKMTRLEIHEPTRELLTGREAHDRAVELFEANVDVALFRALWLQQGVELAQADLSAPTSLGAALDQAVGGPVSSESETTLFQRVREEYERYFTGRHKQNVALKRLIEEHEFAVEEVEKLELQIASLDDKVELITSLSQKISGLQESQKEQSERVSSLTTRWQEIEKHLRQVENFRLEAELASGKCERAQSDLEVRKRLIEAVTTVTRQRDDFAGKLVTLAPGLSTVQLTHNAAKEELDKANSALTEHQALLQRREADYEYRRDEFDVRLMTERQDRVKTALITLHETQSFLSSCRIDSDRLSEIEEAHTNALAARARLDGETAHVELEAYSPQKIEIGGKCETLSTGVPMQRIVEDELIVDLPEILRITITASHGSEALAEVMRISQANLDNKLEAAGASDVPEARSIYRRRVDAERNAESSKSTLKNDLRDLTPEQMADRIRDLAHKTERYALERTSLESLPENLDAAQAARDTARIESQHVQTQLDRAVRDFESVEKSLSETKNDETELGVELRVTQERLDEAKSVLEEAREAEADEPIMERVREHEIFAAGALRTHLDSTVELERSNPDAAKAELETAREVVKRINKQVDELEDQQREARTYLSVKGEEGLHDEFDEAKTHEDHSRRVRVAVEVRAAAAKKLFETMSRYRDEAHRRYQAPFRRKIESLGKIVFGSEFSVELDDNLRIEKANATGVNLRFDQHSTGEREQLGLIARLACASIVSKNGGVPLILDDALGWTDPGRLRTLGAALTVGARECQVIALTCEPGRYRHIGANRVVTIT